MCLNILSVHIVTFDNFTFQVCEIVGESPYCCYVLVLNLLFQTAEVSVYFIRDNIFSWHLLHQHGQVVLREIEWIEPYCLFMLVRHTTANSLLPRSGTPI